MASNVEIKFSAKDLKDAAKQQQQFISQLALIGYQLSEFKAIPVSKSRIDVTLTLSRPKKP